MAHVNEFPCDECERAEGSPNGFSICFACGHVIDHGIGHDCEDYDT